MATVGISIKDQNGELKAMDDILDEMGNKWKTMSKDQQVALAQAVAGVRQYNQLVSLMDNFDFYKENLALAQNAEGTLEEQAKVYEESWEAANNRVKASFEELAGTLINSDFFIGIEDGLAVAISGVDDLAEGLGGLPGILLMIGAAFSKQIKESGTNAIRSVQDMIKIKSGTAKQEQDDFKTRFLNTGTNLGLSGNSAESYQLNAAYQMAAMEKTLSDYSDKITESQREELKNEKTILGALNDRIVKYKELEESAQKRADEQARGTSDRIFGSTLNSRGVRESYDSLVNETIIPGNEQSAETIRMVQAFREQNEAITKGNVGLEKMLTLIGQMSKAEGTAMGIKEQFNSLNRAFQDGTVSEEKYNRELQKLKNLFVELAGEGSELKNLDETLEALFNYRELASESITDNIAGDANQLRASENIAEMSKSYREAGINASYAADGIKTINEALVRFNEDANNMAQTNAQLDFAGMLMERANAFMGLISAYEGIISLTRVWQDEDKSLAEKLLSSASAVTMIAMSLGQATESFKRIQESMDAAKKAAIGVEASSKSAGAGITFLGNSAKGAAASVATLAKAIAPMLGWMIAFTAISAGIGLLADKFHEAGLTSKDAAENIKDATEAYEEEKNKLEELNNSLKTTQDRIEELQSQDTLSFVEREELDNLKQQEKSLERQVELQERLAKAQQAAQAQEIGKKYSKANSKLVDGPAIKSTYASATGYAPASLSETPEQLRDRLNLTNGEYEKANQNYQKVLEENTNITNKWLSENSEAIQQAESDYLAYIEAVQNGAIAGDADKLANMQNTLAQIRKAGSGNDYAEVYIKPVLDDEYIDSIKDKIYNAFANGETTESVSSLVDSTAESILQAAGISVDEFLSYINDQIAQTSNNILDKFPEFESKIKDLTAKDWEILATINLDNTQDFNDFWNKFKELQENGEIDVEVSGIDSIKELLDQLNESENPLETALKSYKDQGYLTMDQVQELIAVDERYADYIIKVGDAYKLTTGALQEMQTLEAQEEQLLDDLIAKREEETNTSRDYIDVYDQMFDQLINDFGESNAAAGAQIVQMKEMAQAYQDGEMSAADYLSTIDSSLQQMESGINGINTAIENGTDSMYAYEGAFASSVGAISDTLMNAQDLLTDGSINMDEYYETMIAGNKALVRAQAELNGNLEQTADGTWVVKDAVELAAKSMDDFKEASQAAANSNAMEKQIEKTEALQGVVDTLVEHYDYLYNFMDNFGIISIENNFDATSAEFKSLVADMTTEISGLYHTNNEAYRSIIQSMADAGANLDANLAYSNEQLTNAIGGDFDILAGAVNGATNAAGTSITQLGKAGGNVLTALGNAIRSFNYYLEFSFEGGGDNIASMLQKGLIDGGWSSIKFPKLKIHGNGEGTSADLGQAIAEAGVALSKFDMGAALGRGNYKNFGGGTSSAPRSSKTPLGTNFETDNLRNKNSGGSKKKGSGSDDTPTQEELKEFEDRYHDINNEIEYQEKILDQVNTNIDRAFGVKKLDLYTKKLKELNKETELYKKKMQEAAKYKEEDLKALESYQIKGLKIDSASGYISNYEEIEKKLIDNYNSVVNKFNALKSKKAQEAMKDELEAAKTDYENKIAVMEKYEEAVKTWHEAAESFKQAMREEEDAKLEKITYKMDVILQIKNMKDAARDFSKTIVESFGDEITHGLKSGELGLEGTKANMDLLKDYTEEYDALKQRLSEATEYTDINAIVDEIEDLQGSVISTGEDLLDWIDEVENKLSDALDDASKRFSLFTDQLEHNSSILGTIKDLMTLQGVTYKTAKGFSDLQKLGQSQLNASLAEAKLNKEWSERARKQLEQAQAALEKVTEEDAAYDTLKNNRDALLSEYNEAQKALYSSAKDAMEQAKDMYVTAIEKAAYDFEKAVTGGDGFDLLQMKYDNAIEKEERYLDAVNERYEVNKWNNKLQKAIDEQTSQYAKDRLKTLKDEINARKEGNKLNQYDLDILEAKYNMTLAQIALEDAQNAKDSVRLVRNASGNWDYQFTANQDNIDEAQSQYEDAQNDYYNIAKNQVKSVMDSILELKQNVADQIKEVYEDETLTEEERAAKIEEIRSTANDKMLYLQEEYNVALRDMTDAGGEIIDEFGNTYQDAMDLMQKGTDDFKDNFEKAIDDMNDAARDYNDTIADVADETGTNLEDLRDKVDEVTDSTERCEQAGVAAADAIWNKIGEIQDATEAWAEYAAQVMEAVYALQKLAAQMGQTVEDVGNGNVGGYNASTDYTAILNQMLSSGKYTLEDEAIQELLRQRDTKIEKENISKDIYGTVGSSTRDMYENLLNGGGNQDWFNKKTMSEDELLEKLRKLGISGFATGGYTGEFADGRLAILHEKELVLNAEDTKNILSAVTLTRALDSTVLTVLNSMNNRLGAAAGVDFGIGTTLEQQVIIQADFPGVTTAMEIQMALSNLANEAAQYATIKK